MDVDDFIDEFYAFDINNWTDSLQRILNILNFGVDVEYVCGWDKFLYERSGKLQYIKGTDRKILSECQEISIFRMGRDFRKISIVAVKITGSKNYRNEKTYEIYKLFRRLYGRFVIFVACFDRDIAFVGTSINHEKKSEVIISDWFGEYTNREVLSRILEIDFALFSFDSIGELYGDYLWAIARPYIKYRESKTFLIYGSGVTETYEPFAQDPDGDGFIPVTKIDIEATLRINASYYPDLYGDDYYIDESAITDDTLETLDEYDAEFEWTMLEMELAKEYIEEDDDFNSEFDEEESEYDMENEDYEAISGMNPEEMLEYIRGE